MAENVIAAVVGKKELIEGAAVPLAVAEAIRAYAVPALYLDTGKIADRIVKELVALARTEAFPRAEKAGEAGALPILKALGERGLTRDGSRARGPALKWLQQREALTLDILREKLEGEAGYLKAELRAWFREAERGQATRKELIGAAVAADKAELASIAEGRAKQLKAQDAAEQVRNELAADPQNESLQAKLADAESEAAKAGRLAAKRATFLGRLEVKAQGHFRDAIRRTAEDTQQATFLSRGYAEFVWIAVNGTDACPDCEARHGREGDMKVWAGNSPGDGGTVCKSACMCHLVPAEYAKANASLVKPLTLKAGPSGKPPGKPAG